MIEEWRPILGYKNRYEVSNLGRVRGPRGIIGWRGKNKYMIVSLHGKRKEPTTTQSKPFIYEVKVYVHQLVAEAFLGPCPEGHEVNHIDTDKSNNVLSNLEYVTRSENLKHAYKNGCRKPNRAFKHTKEIVDRLYERVQAGEKTIRVAKEMGIKATVCYGLIYKRKRELENVQR